MYDRRAADKAKKEAKNSKRLEDIHLIRNQESKLPEVVKLFHHLP